MLLTDGQAMAAEMINPADARGIRRSPPAPPLMLNFLAIKNDSLLEDRTVIEFDVSTLSGTVPMTTLDLHLRELDEGGPVGIIDVFTFFGDGVIAPDDFFAGTFFTSFPANEHLQLVHVDVTAAAQASVDAGQEFIGFRLSTITEDRYDFGPTFPGGIPPTLTVTTVAEPASLTVLSIATLALLLLPAVSANTRKSAQAAQPQHTVE